MVKYILFASLLALPSCATYEKYFDTPSCTEKAAIASQTAVSVSNQVVVLAQQDIIKGDDLANAIKSIDTAQSIAETGGALCAIDERGAEDYIDAASDAIKEVIATLEGLK